MPINGPASTTWATCCCNRRPTNRSGARWSPRSWKLVPPNSPCRSSPPDWVWRTGWAATFTTRSLSSRMLGGGTTATSAARWRPSWNAEETPTLPAQSQGHWPVQRSETRHPGVMAEGNRGLASFGGPAAPCGRTTRPAAINGAAIGTRFLFLACRSATELTLLGSRPGTWISSSGSSILNGKELIIVYHTHADPTKPSGERVVNIDRLQFDEDGRLKITGPTRSPQPMPSSCS